MMNDDGFCTLLYIVVTCQAMPVYQIQHGLVFFHILKKKSLSVISLDLESGGTVTPFGT